MASFLSPLLKASAADEHRLIDTRTGQLLADRLVPAFDSKSRKTGLLKHSSLPAGTAMIIAPCSGVHTFFMKFPIDVVFVSKDGRVLKIRHELPAWRMTASITAFAVIEMAAGSAQRAGLQPGARLAVLRHAAIDKA